MGKRKKVIIPAILLVLAVLLVVNILVFKSGKVLTANLMTAEKIFVYDHDAEERYDCFIRENKLQKIFKRQVINSLYPDMKWSGRIKYSGISYHSLFTVDKAKIIFKLPKLAGGFTFSLYHPPGAKLFYFISLKSENKQQKLFGKFFNKESFVSENINIEHPYNSEVELIFESKGRGVGAWINPRLKNKPQTGKIVIVIVLDTLRYDHTSLYGYFRKTTPVLDSIAQEAVVFKNAYSTTSWTLPAHVSLFSGKHLGQHGVAAPTDRIPVDLPLIAEVFQKNDYLTVAFTGGGFIEDTYGFFRGFQLYSNIPGRVLHIRSAEKVFNHFVKYIDKYWGNNLFVFLHTYQLHAPYKAPHKYINKINGNIKTNLRGFEDFMKGKREYFKKIAGKDRSLLIDLYDAGILYADEMLLGNIVDFLKRKGVYDDTMLVVLSDHGEEFYDHFSWGHSHSLYRELIQIPVVIKYPKSKRVGQVASLFSISDIAGIILHESGLSYLEESFSNNRAEGIMPSLLPVSPVIRQFPSRISLVTEDYHFILNIIDKKKFSFFNPRPPAIADIELFAIEDFREKNNIAAKKKKRVAVYRKHLVKYLKQMGFAKTRKFKISKELEEKLKTLGYLGN